MKTSVRAAMCGVLTALAVVFLLLVPILPVLLYCSPVLAGLCTAIACEEFGARYSLGVFVSVSVLSLLFVADKEAVLVFILLTGSYPILKHLLDSSKNDLLQKRPIPLFIKLAYVNAACITYFFAATRLFGIPADSFGVRALKIVFLIVGNIIMLIYDKSIENIMRIYKVRFKNKVFK